MNSIHPHNVRDLALSVSLGNIVMVAKEGGDFRDPLSAMASISGASQNNPYLMLIGPGVFNLSETLIIKRFVGIAGSGRNTTVLKGTISGSSKDTVALMRSLSGTSDVSSLSFADRM